MDLVLKALSQMPLVAIVAYMWWTTRRDMMQELERLRRRVADKDRELHNFAEVFDKLSLALELIKDRLR